MRNNIDCFLNKKEAKEKTQEKIDEMFWEQIKNEINSAISKAIESRQYKVVLDSSYNKYYKLIKVYYKREKHYKVKKLYEEYFFDYKWEGIRIEWS